MFTARLRGISKMGGSTARGGTDESIRLCQANMDIVGGIAGVKAPAYDRSRVTPGVINLGLRDFHRVHNAVYFDELLKHRSNSSWGMISVALSEPQRKLVPGLKVQNSLYTVVSKTEEGGSDIRVVGSILDCKTSLDDAIAVSDLIGSNTIRIVTLTLKESNYFFTTDFSKLNANDPHIRFDVMSGKQRPQRTPVGILVAGLYKRFMNKGHPLTVLSCENLPRNGEIARSLVEQYAVLRYPLAPPFHRWLSANVFYPNTMCDRICLTDPSQDRIALQQMFGVRDNALLTTEHFSEWVIEKWMGDKPEGLKDVGIKLVPSTVPYENLKIRLNYGTRLSVAIIAKALGFTRFEDAMKDAVVRKFAEMYMNEVVRGLGDVPKDVDIDQYKIHAIKRMSTEQLNYVTHRVVESASKKLRTDLQPVLEASISPSPVAALAIAAWAHLLADSALCKTDGFPLIDASLEKLEPLAKELIASVRQSSAKTASRMFISEIFGNGKSFNERFSDDLINALKEMEHKGIRGSLESALN